MNAFTSLILLIAIAAVSMGVVAYSNYLVEKAKKTTFALEKMKIRVEELEDVVLVLDTICEKRIIPKLVNDEILEQYDRMIEIAPKEGYLKAGLSNAQMRSNDLSDESSHRQVSRICKSDAQMARYQAYLGEALNILRKQHADSKIANKELQVLAMDIEWLQLQIKVISNIVQGHKAYAKKGVMSANPFYKKAQSELLRSSHPDERRHKMITQIADMLFGRRKSLDVELMPESEFNPDESAHTEAENSMGNNSDDSTIDDELQQQAMMHEQAKINNHRPSV